MNLPTDHCGIPSRARSMLAALLAIAVTIGALLLNTAIVFASGLYAFYPLDVQFPGAGGTTLYSRNANGDVVGTYYEIDTGIEHGFVLRNGHFSSIDPPGSLDTV